MKLALCIVAAMTLLVGCTFERQLVNDQFRDLDVSFIKVGKTTVYDVLDRIGPPSPVNDITDNASLVSSRHLRYVCFETRTTRFLFALGLVLPFQWTDSQQIEEIFIELDQQGIVSGVSRTTRETVRPPFQSSSGRSPLEFEDLTPSLR